MTHDFKTYSDNNIHSCLFINSNTPPDKIIYHPTFKYHINSIDNDIYFYQLATLQYFNEHIIYSKIDWIEVQVPLHLQTSVKANIDQHLVLNEIVERPT